jgi:hypothetical protein
VIHVDVSTQANLDFLEFLSSDEKWRRAPDSVRGGKSNQSETSFSQAATSRIPPGAPSASSSLNNDFSAIDQTLWPPPDGLGDGKPRSKKSSKKSSDGLPQAQAKNPQSDDQTLASQRSDSSALTAVLARLEQLEKNLEQTQSDFQKDLAKVVQSSEAHHEAVNTRLHSVDTLGDTLVQRLTSHQDSAMLSMKTQLESMLSHMLSTFIPQSIPPPPPPSPHVSQPSDPSDIPFFPVTSSPNPPIPSAHAHPQSQSSGSASVQSGGSGSTRSYSSDVELPQQKKPRGSIQTDMAQLSLQPPSDGDSETMSDLEDIYSGPSSSLRLASHSAPTDRSPWSPVVDDESSELMTLDATSNTTNPNIALPDLDLQYKFRLIFSISFHSPNVQPVPLPTSQPSSVLLLLSPFLLDPDDIDRPNPRMSCIAHPTAIRFIAKMISILVSCFKTLKV